MSVLVLLLAVLVSLLVVSSGLLKFQTVKMELNWTDAQKHCREKFADLATIVTAEEMQYFDVGPHNNLGETFWIGLYDDVNSWTWSIDGTYFENNKDEFGNWMDNEGGDEHCAQIYNGTLEDKSCAILTNAVCYDNYTDAYVLSMELMNFQDAKTFCRLNFTDLTDIKNKTALEDVVAIVGNESSWWIGLSREAWKWSDQNTSTVAFWKTNQTSNELGDEYCAFAASGGLEDAPCEEEKHFVCSIAPKKHVFLMFVLRTNSVDFPTKDFLLEAIKENILETLAQNGIHQHVRLTWN